MTTGITFNGEISPLGTFGIVDGIPKYEPHVELDIDCPPTHVEGATITWVGEAPGVEEKWKGEGWVGKAGQLLRMIAAVGGVEFDKCNRTNVVKRKPPGNDFKKEFYVKEKVGKKKVTKPTAELEAWYEDLGRELRSHPTNVVVAVGVEALKALTGLDKITACQGSVYDSTLVPGQKVIAMVHPSAVLQGQDWQQVYVSGRVVKDVVVPESRAAFPVLVKEWQEFIGPSIEDVRLVINDAIKHQARWTIDLEVRGGTISCVGLGFSRGYKEHEVALVVPVETTHGPYWTPEEEYEFWCLLQELSDANHNLVGQNMAYDLDWLIDYGFVPGGVLLDCMQGHRVLYAELPKKLQFTNFFYATGIPYYKDEGKSWGKKTPDLQVWKYNSKDLIAHLRVSYSVERELKSRGLWEHYQEEGLRTLPLVLEMQRRYLPTSKEDLDWVREVVLGERTKVQDALTKMLGHEVNVGSPVELPKLLYTELRFPHLFGRSNADEDALVALRTWLAGQKPAKHTSKCRVVSGKVTCKHLTTWDLEHMEKVLELVMRIKKIKKALSSYLAKKLYGEV